MRVLPGMTVLAPCDESELRAGLAQALELDGPTYMRIGKKGEPAKPSLQSGQSDKSRRR